jgi:hypothetical protein
MNKLNYRMMYDMVLLCSKTDYRFEELSRKFMMLLAPEEAQHGEIHSLTMESRTLRFRAL